MKIVKQSIEIIKDFDPVAMMKKIEICGRVCYKSEDRITEDSYKDFLYRIQSNGHDSLLEHGSVTVKFICDRAIANEITRHRLASFCQESTRFIKYEELTFIDPEFEDEKLYASWISTMSKVEVHYNHMIFLGAKAQDARSILPLSLKTELYMTVNLRELKYIINLRSRVNVHPQLRKLMIALNNKLYYYFPEVFNAM